MESHVLYKVLDLGSQICNANNTEYKITSCSPVRGNKITHYSIIVMEEGMNGIGRTINYINTILYDIAYGIKLQTSDITTLEYLHEQYGNSIRVKL